MNEEKKQRKHRRRREGFSNRSNAVCVVAYDMGGKVIPDEVATRIVNAIYDVTKEEKLAINFTRT